MHACAGNGLIKIHQVFALTEGIEKHSHSAHIERMGPYPHEVVQNSGYFVKHDTNVFGPFGNIQLEQFFDCHHVTVFIAHHRHIVESIHVTNSLVIRLGFRELLCTPMQQANMWVRTLDDFPIHFEHQTQHAMRGRMLGTKIKRVIFDFRHRRLPRPAHPQNNDYHPG